MKLNQQYMLMYRSSDKVVVFIEHSKFPVANGFMRG